jgi:uncharacterized protein (DUF1697 family)
MPVFIALLRGINVGGHKKVRMSDLKAICDTIGLEDVQTYLQSGNVVFSSRRAATGALARSIETALQERAGVEARILLRTTAELRNVVAGNPFKGERDPSRLMVAFLDGELTKEAKAALQKAAADDEELHFAVREVYIYFPEGAGNSKLMGAMTEKKLGVAATTRNWNTVTALLRLAEAAEA